MARRHRKTVIRVGGRLEFSLAPGLQGLLLHQPAHSGSTEQLTMFLPWLNGLNNY